MASVIHEPVRGARGTRLHGGRPWRRLTRPAGAGLAAAAAALLCSCATPNLPMVEQIPPLPDVGAALPACPGTVCVVSVPRAYADALIVDMEDIVAEPGGCCTDPVTLSYKGYVRDGTRPRSPRTFPLNIQPAALSAATTAMLEAKGCRVLRPDEEYITRAMRLSVDRVIVPRIARVHYYKHRTGIIVDYRVEFSVEDPRDGRTLGQAGAWGRSDGPDLKAIQDAIRRAGTSPELHTLICPLRD